MMRPPLAPEVTSLLANSIDDVTGQAQWLSGLLGEHPSSYSRSPALWNAVYRELGLDAAYAPFDVPPDRLEAFVQTGIGTVIVAGVITLQAVGLVWMSRLSRSSF